MTKTIREAIDTAELATLRAELAADPTLADADVVWGAGGRNRVPPLHYVSDAVFRRLATQEQALAMAKVLLAAGVDPEREYAKSGDTFLITAASLGAELVGVHLVELGVDVKKRGLFDATALHWAAFMGLGQLAAALVAAGAELELHDTKYECTPLQWALYGWRSGTNGNRDGIPRVARVLVEHGARVPQGAVESLGDADIELRAALEAAPRDRPPR